MPSARSGAGSRRVREARGPVKVHETPRHGKVARVFAEEGFGFIQTDDGSEFYFSRDNVVHPRFEDLGPGVASGSSRRRPRTGRRPSA